MMLLIVVLCDCFLLYDPSRANGMMNTHAVLPSIMLFSHKYVGSKPVVIKKITALNQPFQPQTSLFVCKANLAAKKAANAAGAESATSVPGGCECGCDCKELPEG